MRTRRTWFASVAAVLVALAVIAPVQGQAATPAERTASAQAGARWLVERFEPGGFLVDVNDDPDLANTAQSALSLAAVGTFESTFDAAVSFLEDNVDAYVSPGGTDDNPGSLGYLLLLADAAGLPGDDFGGHDLIARLEATLGTLEPGLYGAGDPTFDGVFRQSLAILGLAAHDRAPDPAAIDWLVDQQCSTGSAAAAIGGWQSYRPDTTVPCTAPDSNTFTGPDSNSTALAIEALAALGVAPPEDALAFLDSTQDANGGWAFLDGLDVDPNSTALVIMALVSRGEDPDSGRWREAGGSAYDSLLAWQIVDGDPLDVGGFATPFSGGFADLLATEQAVWGIAGRSFPFGPVQFGAPVSTPATSPGVDGDDGGPSGGGGGGGDRAATRPRFTG